MASSKRGLVATAAIIALLVVVIGIGLVNFTAVDHTVTLTESSTTTATTTLPAISKTTTLKTTVTLRSTATQLSTASFTTTYLSTNTVTANTTITFAQPSGQISQITVAEAALKGGTVANATSGATSSLLIAFYNPNSTTYITSVILSSAISSPIVSWDNSSALSSLSNSIVFSSMHPGNNIISSRLTTFFSYYPESYLPETIQPGTVYQYIVFFATGAYVEGNLTAG